MGKRSATHQKPRPINGAALTHPTHRESCSEDAEDWARAGLRERVKQGVRAESDAFKVQMRVAL
jgi:hypothetical protein